MALTQEQKDSGMMLRFSEGDRVACNIGGWAAGTVAKQWYRDESWPQGKWAPYQVQLDQGTLIYAPIDDDKAIKALAEEDEKPREDPEPKAPMTWDEIAAWDTCAPPPPSFAVALTCLRGCRVQRVARWLSPALMRVRVLLWAYAQSTKWSSTGAPARWSAEICS
jgi:hypothetical protein